MLPLVIPEIVYWIICEKSVIEPNLTGGQELYSPFLEGSSALMAGGQPSNYTTFSYKIYNSTKVVF
jgi:hypothetical protein